MMTHAATGGKTVVQLQEMMELEDHCEILDVSEVQEDFNFRSAYAFYKDWLEVLITENKLPCKSFVNPTQIRPAVLPYVVLLDALDQGEDYHWRLFGSRHEEEYGANLTGMKLSDLIKINESAEGLKEILDLAYETRREVFYRIFYKNQGQVRRQASGVMLPLADEEDDEVRYMVSVTYWI